MANKKMTKREMFEAIKASYPLTEAEVAFIDHELELLAKKNAGDSKPTATQVANEGFKTEILAVLGNEPMTITKIQKSSEALSELSNQRISALVRQLVADGSVVRTEVKRKAYFALA